MLLRLILLPLLLSLAACNLAPSQAETETLPVDELYSEGKSALENGNYDRAERYMKRLVARFPFGRYTEQAQLELAFSQYKRDKSDEALATVNRFIKTYPTHPNVDYAYYLRGLINFDRNHSLFDKYLPDDSAQHDQQTARQAFLDFSELLKRYPNSRYAADARSRMLFLRNNLATYELRVAEYYLRRGAYVAAANRGKHILETYQQSPHAADALAVMVQAYDRLGEKQLADDTMEVLKLNAPDHPFLSGGNRGKRGFWTRLWPFGKKDRG